MAENILEINNLSVKRGSFCIENLSLTIKRGEIFALLGKTGSGKTLLLECICGFYKHISGEILMNGQNIAQLPLNRRNMGFVYQDHGLFPHMTVWENIAYGLKRNRTAKEKIKTTVCELAQAFAISHALKQYPGTLSGGESQRTALARALVLKPEILILDEPFTALDPMTKKEMYAFIQNIKEHHNCTILFVTHDFHEAQKLAQRIGIMRQGALRRVVPSEDLFSPCEDEDLNRFLGLSN